MMYKEPSIDLDGRWITQVETATAPFHEYGILTRLVGFRNRTANPYSGVLADFC